MLRRTTLVPLAAIALSACGPEPNAPNATALSTRARPLIVADPGFTWAVADGQSHSCALKADGALACWGANDYGQTNVPPGPFAQVSEGDRHSCALRTDGVAVCWGNNWYGQTTNIPSATSFKELRAGGWHTCGIKTDGTLACWGYSGYGATSPPGDPGITFKQLTSGGWHSCAIQTDDVVRCWGRNYEGQGTPTDGPYVQISAGGYHTCGLKADGTIQCWGSNAWGQKNVPGGTYTFVEAGDYQTCAVRTDRSVVCWGMNNSGESSPVPPGTYMQVSTGIAHSCGVKTDGFVACWGRNTFGESAPPGMPTTHVLPTATFTAPASVNEGATFSLSLTNAAVAGHPEATTFTYAFDCGDGLGYSAFSAANTRSCSAANDGTLEVRGRVKDQDGDTQDYPPNDPAKVTVANVAPVVTVTGPVDPIGLATASVTAAITVSYTDPGTLDPHTVTVDCGNGTLGSPSAGAYTCVYTAPGIYSVSGSVKDDRDTGTDTYQYVVVYDPSAGFVTGGGWIGYTSNACPTLCGGIAGQGDFGFTAKYEKRAELPSGNARFEFRAGTLQFVSTSYEWLVVSGSRARFKGVGQINGAGSYGFAITAVDGTPDAFRIKIWDRATDQVVFDNQWGESENSPVATALDKVHGNGSVVIHVK